MKPGVANLPVASITRAPLGTVTEALGPAAAMRLPRMTIVASGTAGPPLPSISVAPTSAITLSPGGTALFGARWAASVAWALDAASAVRRTAARRHARTKRYRAITVILRLS